MEEDWKDSFRSNGTQNLMMLGHLVRILSLLDENNISAVPFKGPVLSIQLYGDLALRSFSDIDVLIHRKHLSNAVDLLAQLGFHPYFSLNGKQLEKLSQTDNEYPLLNQKSGITLDLQWELSGGYFARPITLNDLNENLNTLECREWKMPVFSDEFLLFYLCVHGNQHTWKQLDHACCVATLIQSKPNLDWEKVFSTAETYKAVRILQIGLFLIHELFNITPKESLSFHLKEDPRVIALTREISGKILSHSTNSSLPEGHRFMKYHFLSMDTPGLAIRYALRLFLFPTRFDWQLHPLPARISFLHYLIRPLRLSMEGIKTIFQRTFSRCID